MDHVASTFCVGWLTFVNDGEDDDDDSGNKPCK